MKEVVVYQADSLPRGKIWVPKKPEKNRLVKWFARILMIFGLTGFLIFIGPFIALELKWRLGKIIFPQQVEPENTPSGFGYLMERSNLEILQPPDPRFSLVIPKIGVNTLIIADVSVGNENDYQEALKNGVAHAKGSYYPGERGTIFLFGHSTNYLWYVNRLNATFYLLKELETGDQVNVFHQGQRYVYRVEEKKTMAAGDLSLLKPRFGKEELVLQTCWPPGTTWKRLVVIAHPMNEPISHR